MILAEMSMIDPKSPGYIAIIGCLIAAVVAGLIYDTRRKAKIEKAKPPAQRVKKNYAVPIVATSAMALFSVIRIATAKPGANLGGLIGGLVGILGALAFTIFLAMRQKDWPDDVFHESSS